MAEPVPPTIPPGKIRLTYEDYLVLPDDGKRYEIIDGGLHVTPAPTPRHQRISQKIELTLVLSLAEKGKGQVFDAPIDVVLDQENVIQPDIIFIRSENLDIIGDRNIQGAPDLIVEILSPSTRRRDVLVKSALYARFGVSHYWIADPDLDRIEVFGLSDDGSYELLNTFNHPDVLRMDDYPELELPLEKVFG